METENLEADDCAQMKEDNTPPRKRRITGKMRMRLETARKLREIRQNATKRNEPKAKQAKENNQRNPDIPGQVREPKVKKNKLQDPPTPPVMFRKRQIHKTWLPTHLYHTKRAHMTAPKEPLWRFALPLTPTNKSYRVTHRASGQRGAVAWDTSYMSTVGLQGPEKSIQGLFRALGVGFNNDEEGVWAKKGERWRRGTRSWSGWLFEREGWPKKPIGPATIIWQLDPPDQECFQDAVVEGTERPIKMKKHRRKAFIRTHPSTFLQLWEEVLRLAKVQKPTVMVEDLRFEIGSVEIAGPAASETLLTILRPSQDVDNGSGSDDHPSKIWNTIGSVGNPASTPAGALLAFEVQDPRLHFPARKADAPLQDSTSQFRALSLLSIWPPDRTQTEPAIFDRAVRLKAQREMPSQKAINRRKALATPGTLAESKSTDPRIPIMLLANRCPPRGQGSWTLLLPWKCVKPVWYCLMHVPLSTGGSIRFGGQREAHQVTFEAGLAWFPGDFPGTRAGWEWEDRERKRQKEEWERRRKGKRVEWGSVVLGNGRKGEVGLGWGCDWERLVHGPDEAEQKGDSQTEREQRQEKSRGDVGTDRTVDNNATTEKEKGGQKVSVRELGLFHLRSSIAHPILSSASAKQDVPADALITVKLSFLASGVAVPCSRIYRLPIKDPTLRQEWLSLLPDHGSSNNRNKKKDRFPRPLPKDATQNAFQQRLVRVLFEPMPINPGSKEYPSVPDERDLIGFVTSGSYNLGEGQGIGIGSLLLSRVVETSESLRGEKEGKGSKEVKKGIGMVDEKCLCVVREAGLSFGRLAMWEVC